MTGIRELIARIRNEKTEPANKSADELEQEATALQNLSVEERERIRREREADAVELERVAQEKNQQAADIRKSDAQLQREKAERERQDRIGKVKRKEFPNLSKLHQATRDTNDVVDQVFFKLEVAIDEAETARKTRDVAQSEVAGKLLEAGADHAEVKQIFTENDFLPLSKKYAKSERHTGDFYSVMDSLRHSSILRNDDSDVRRHFIAVSPSWPRK
jgi:hypothetical protein